MSRHNEWDYDYFSEREENILLPPETDIDVYAETVYMYECPACKTENALRQAEINEYFECTYCQHQMWVNKIYDDDNNWNVMWTIIEEGKLFSLSVRMLVRAVKNIFNLK
jgi:DNA-directed RNA polymerase subunit RPC12/RpoP